MHIMPIPTAKTLVFPPFRFAARLTSNRSSSAQKTTLKSLVECRTTDDEMEVDWDGENEGIESVEDVLHAPWLLEFTNTNVSLRRKEIARERNQRWVFKNTQTRRSSWLVRMCANNLGPDTAIQVFGKVGGETCLEDYNALIKICIEKARVAADEDASIEQIYQTHQIFNHMREKGFEIEEETYGQFLLYLIDFGKVEEFFYFHQLIQDENPDSLPRLTYYEMILWLRVNNEVKVQELLRSALDDGAEDNYYLREQLLLALCESDRKKEFLMLLETVDITKFTSVAYLVRLFRSLGKFQLEPFAERFLLALKTSDIGSQNISNFVCEYAISIPYFAVKDVITKFRALHTKLEMWPSSAHYERLVKYSCEFLKVHEALSLVNEAFGSGVALSLEAFHAILDACYQSREFYLVHRINTMIRRQNLKPNNDTFRMMILLCAKMKDFKGAYRMINDLEIKNLMPTGGAYIAMMSGYYRNIPEECM